MSHVEDKAGCVPTLRVQPRRQPLCGIFHPPGDRRITHRALILGALALGQTYISGALESAETVATRRVMAQLGISFLTDEEGWLVVSRRDTRLASPTVELDCGNSASTLILALGLIAGQRVEAVLTGGSDLLGLDLSCLLPALTEMGARVEVVSATTPVPARIRGARLQSVECQVPPGAYEQKDALILAGLQAQGITRLTGMVNGCDHLERLLKLMSVTIRRSDGQLSIKGEQNIHPRRIKVPGDVSAAAPFIVLASLLPESDLLISQLGANPSRMGLIKTLIRNGAHVSRERNWQFGAEPVCDFRVKHSPGLPAFNVAPNLAPFLPDEMPLLALLATQTEGTSRLKCGPQPPHQAPDMLQVTAQILRQFGADIELEEDGFTVHGPTPLAGAEVQCANCRQLALLAITAALLAEGESTLHGAGIIEDTYPGLIKELGLINLASSD